MVLTKVLFLVTSCRRKRVKFPMFLQTLSIADEHSSTWRQIYDKMFVDPAVIDRVKLWLTLSKQLRLADMHVCAQ